jgi:CheY-like chemotaxis protein
VARKLLSALTLAGQDGAALYDGVGVTKQILIIEDDGDSREVFSEILSAAGFGCVCARNGREALAYLRRNPLPNVILLDMFMPQMDGWQFRREQLADPAFSRIPVIVVSAARTTMRSAIGFGAAGFLQKPIQPKELLNAVGVIA